MRATIITTIIIVLLAFAVSIAFYKYLPDKVATHWDASGDVNGYMSRPFGAFLMPIVIAVLVLFFILFPYLDPLKSNIDKFKKYYHGFIILITAMFFLLHVFLLLWNIGIKFSITLIMPIWIGILFFYVGVLLKHAKRNWFIGIRTPWTLSSEKVWNKTHKLGSVLFIVCGVISIISAFSGRYAFYFVLGPMIISVVVVFVYSYLEFQKEKKH